MSNCTCNKPITPGADDTAAPLAEASYKHLGVQASEHIMRSADSLQALVSLTSQLPSLAKGLSERTVNSTLLKHFKNETQSLPPGHGHMLVNGLSVCF